MCYRSPRRRYGIVTGTYRILEGLTVVLHLIGLAKLA